jgi:altronate dehydratase
MSEFVSWLESVGKAAEQDFEKALPWLQKAGGIITVFDPSLGSLFNSTVNIVSTVEQKYAVLGKQSGTGASKLADAIQIGEPIIAQGLKLAGQSSTTADVTNYINSVVAVLNAVPAPAKA